MQQFRTASSSKGHPPGALFRCFIALLPTRPGVRTPTALLGLLGSWLALVFSATALAANDTAPSGCSADQIDERVTVERLYDGDTVKLNDGRKVRFIGIDTPEIGHNGAPSQPLANAARDALQALLEKSNHTIGLRYDTERQDRYARDLAHVYLNDGSSVAAHLLERGLATIMPFPPNLWNLPCYQATEQRARTARRGIWALPEYQPIDAAQLRQDDKGMRLIKGKVTASRLLKSDVWLTLNDTVMLHIGQRDRKYFAESFSGTFPAEMSGRTVIARGRLYFTEGAPRMQIRHPASLQIVQ